MCNRLCIFKYWFILFCFIAFSSCNNDLFNFDSISDDIVTDTEVALPFVYSSMDFFDFIQNEEGRANATIAEDGLIEYRILKNDAFHVQSSRLLPDFLILPFENIEYLRDDYTTIGSLKKDKTALKKSGFSEKNILNRIRYKKDSKLIIDISSASSGKFISMTFPSVINAENKALAIDNYRILADGENQFIVPISDYMVNIGDVSGTMKLPYELSYTGDKEILVSVRIEGDYDWVDGEFSNITYPQNGDPVLESIPLIPSDALLGNNVILAGSRFDLIAVNGLGASIRIDSNARGKDKNQKNQFIVYGEDSVEINPALKSITSLIDFDVEKTESKGEISADSIRFDGTKEYLYQVNKISLFDNPREDGFESGFIKSGEQLTMNVQWYIPLIAMIDNLKLSSTLNLSKVDETNALDSIYLYVDYKNGLPLDIDVEVQFTDSQGKILPYADIIDLGKIETGTIDEIGNVIASKEDILVHKLSDINATYLKEGQNLTVSLNANSPNNGKQVGRFRDKDSLKISIAVKSAIDINKLK